jgi:FtsP/CotA-like multicopper oxidase with cupredoxin domain
MAEERIKNMYAITRHVPRIGALLLLVALIAVVTALSGGSVALAAPAGAPIIAALPTTSCTPTGPSAVTCDLWAMEGTLTLADASSVNIWGFSDSAAGTAQLPGPVLIVNQGDTVTVNFTNGIVGETVALAFPGQNMIQDLTGVATGASTSYVFTPTVPGTYSYEAGLTPNGNRQVAMGLFGALVVRPAGDPGSAYGTGTAFDDEYLLVLNEIDPAFNTDPNNFAMQGYKAKYRLINGQSFPDTDLLPTAPGDRVLLRYLNGGIRSHYAALLGLEQTVLGIDSSQLPYTYTVTSEALGSGQALDVMVTIPISATAGERYALYDPGLQLHNAGALAGDGTTAFGGILTFLEVSGGAALPDVGPLASDVSVTPSPTSGSSGVILSATLDETSTGGSNVVAWEFFIDELGADGSSVYSYTIASPAVTTAVNTTIPSATLALLPAGDVTFYVHGRDANDKWGPVGSAVLDLVTEGPVIRSQSVTPDTTNGAVNVILRATADDTPTGNINVTAAEYFIDTPGANGAGTALTVDTPAPLVGLEATIVSTDVMALSEGLHTIWIHGLDALGNWGAFGTVDLLVDKTGPNSQGLGLVPNPNNGTLPVNPYSYAVRLTIRVGDDSVIERAEGFIDYNPVDDPDGSGFPLMAVDALFNTTLEDAFVDIPLPTISLLSEGPHSIDFHGKDIAGNWGDIMSMTLIVDKTGPDITQIEFVSDPTGGATRAAVIARAVDPANGAAPASNIVAAEWFQGTDPGPGNGRAMRPQDLAFDSSNEVVRNSFRIAGWTNGQHTIYVRAKDAAGNWGPVTSVTFTVSGNSALNILLDGFETGDLAAWDPVVGNVAALPEAAMLGDFGLKATLNGTAPTYLVDQTPFGEKYYQASFYYSPNDAVTADQSHDIFVGHNAEGTRIFGLQFEQGASGPEVRAWVRSGGVDTYTNWYHINTAAQQLAIEWTSGADASFSLSIDGAVQETLGALDTAAYDLYEVWLGPSGGLADGMAGSEYYDAFVSMRAAQAQHVIYLPVIRR